jgi:ABC-type transport system involved in multi-copper enzyme maturation permease subunit
MLAAELLKVRKRWMPYVLLLVMAAGAAIQIWLVGYVTWRNEDTEFQQSALRAFALPWSLAALLDAGQFWGGILVGILTASTVATEHAWGTVRQALVRGQTRNQYLAMKLLASGLLAVVSLLLAFGIGVCLSVVATTVADRPITLDVPGGPSAGDIVLMVVRAGYGVLPYGLLAFCLATVGRSTTLGVAGILLYMFGETILLAILEGIGGAAADAQAFLIGHNVRALLAANRIGLGDYNSMAPRPNPMPSDLPDLAVAGLVVGLYCLAFLAIAFVIFRRRDIRG